MENKIDIVFNSDKEISFQIASGHISATNILFEKEGIVATVYADGSAEFYGADGKLLAKGAVPKEESGKGKYQEICLNTEGDILILKFPICEWVDHYPNCDGEHDRWSTKTVGYHTLRFNKAINSVTVE